MSTDRQAQSHAGLDQGGTGAQTLPISACDPAILANAHQAETGTGQGQELAGAQMRGLGEQRGQYGIALIRLGGQAVDEK